MDIQAFKKRINAMTEDELVALAAQSPAIHFSTCITIINKEGVEIRPTPNILQIRMSEGYEIFQYLRRPLRMIICKPRQVGCSTFAQHIVYLHARQSRVKALVISDKKDNSADLMEKAIAYESCDSYDWGQTMSSTANNVNFSHGSTIEIDSAENHKAGIGKTRQAFHASEVSKWPRGGVKSDKKTMAAVMPSVAKVGATLAIAESTPDGASGWFYDTWDSGWTIEEFLLALKEGRDPGIVWIKIFAAWFEFDEHQSAVSDSERSQIKKSLSKREQEGVQKYGWSEEQIAWRRSTMTSDCAGNEDTFDEYYPEDDVSCFLASGAPRFNMTAITNMERDGKSMPMETGYLTTQETGSISWSNNYDGSGDVEIWEQPRVGCRYLVACDPATGADQTASKDPDRTSIQVWRQGYYDDLTGTEHKAKMVARVKGPYFGEGDQVAGAITRLSGYYGGCIVILEVNMGLHILELLKLAGVPLYVRRVLDAKTSGMVEQYGFKLKDREIRRALIQALATAIREGEIEVGSQDWIREAKAFVTTTAGRDEAKAGEHDDDILCTAMGWYCIGNATELKENKRRKRKPKDHKDWKSVGDHSGGW